ncbi:MAG: FeoA domain-containing protein [Planctomycetes bacterium]|nr:FeoA domain-containing protein [Planctomycetota bacterium]MCC7397190.1 FeoA domain-containing protein [Planctomycetota bacterium]
MGLTGDAAGLELDLVAGDLDGHPVRGGLHGRAVCGFVARRQRSVRLRTASPWLLVAACYSSAPEILSQQVTQHRTFPPAAAVAVVVPAAGRFALPELGRRCCATVVHVAGDDALSRRLAASGFWSGAVVERLGAAPFGDPLLFRLHGYRIALRREEAARVVVEERCA